MSFSIEKNVLILGGRFSLCTCLEVELKPRDSRSCKVLVLKLVIFLALRNMSWLWEKSGTWRWVVMNSKHSKGFFLAFTSICLMSSWALGEAVMRTTNLSQTQLDEELRKRGRSDSMMVGRVNKERLGQLLGEIQRKENTEDRYSAALRGETLTGPPGARVRGGAGTSMQASSFSPSSSQSDKISVSLQTGPGATESKLPTATTS